ncbi:MAG: hypothetical protein F6K58_12465 [Symploca sp. SIO2E9]|nr:hypothetical protein [Symploca sp. SIO2E9]
MSEKRCGEIIKQTLQTLQTLQTRRNQIPRKISFTPSHPPEPSPNLQSKATRQPSCESSVLGAKLPEIHFL